MSAFYQPTTWTELITDLQRMTKQGHVLAGGTDLIPSLRHRKDDAPAQYLSLIACQPLHALCVEGNFLKIGAMVTHSEAAGHPMVQNHFQALAQACAHVGSVQIRNKGTLIGNIMNGSPAGDVLPCAYLYHGEAELLDHTGSTRRLSLQDLPRTATGRVGCPVGTIMTALYLPITSGLQSAFVKLGSRREVTIAQISFALSWHTQDALPFNFAGYLGAVDTQPLAIAPLDFLDGHIPNTDDSDHLGQILSETIRNVRMRRKRASKMKIFPEEKLYKERAVFAVSEDILHLCVQSFLVDQST